MLKCATVFAKGCVHIDIISRNLFNATLALTKTKYRFLMPGDKVAMDDHFSVLKRWNKIGERENEER